MPRLSTLISGLLILLSGCASVDPYGYEKPVLDEQRYQADPMTRYVLGLPAAEDHTPLTAPIGGLSASTTDHYMAQQTEALKAELGDTGVGIERKGNQIRLIMPGNITFATGSHALQTSFLPILDSVARVLVHFDQTQLQVAGYTDSRGTAEYNQKLSLLRAEAVQRYLVNSGITEARVASQGMGEKNPVASNKTEEGRAKNRRVELQISALN